MRPVDPSSNESPSPFPAGEAAARLSVRGLTELVAQLIGVDGHPVIVIAIVTDEGRAPETGRHLQRRRRRAPRAGPLTAAKEPPPDESRWACLTPRERTVARLAGHALTNQQIANRLQISPHTVNFHMRQVFRKLSIDSRVSLARIVQAQPSVVDSTRGDPPPDA